MNAKCKRDFGKMEGKFYESPTRDHSRQQIAH